MYIVYQHRRLDNNIIFYIGIGKDKNRAHNKSSRSKPWKDMIKNHMYIVEIIHEGITKQEAILIEIDLIKKYGRRDLGTGELVNMTDGGEQHSGFSGDLLKRIHTTKAHDKVRLKTNNFDHLKTKESRIKAANNRNYNDISKKRSMKMDYSKVLKILNSTESIVKRGMSKRIPILQYDIKGNLIKEWGSVTEATNELNINNIQACCKGRRKTAGGFKWEYKNK